MLYYRYTIVRPEDEDGFGRLLSFGYMNAMENPMDALPLSIISMYAQKRTSSNNVYNRRDFFKTMAEWAQLEYAVSDAVALKFQNLRWRIEHLGYEVPIVVDAILSARDSAIYEMFPELIPRAPYRPGQARLMEVRAAAVNAAIAVHFASYIDLMLQESNRAQVYTLLILLQYLQYLHYLQLSKSIAGE